MEKQQLNGSAVLHGAGYHLQCQRYVDYTAVDLLAALEALVTAEANVAWRLGALKDVA
jgi:hypothetical protein